MRGLKISAVLALCMMGAAGVAICSAEPPAAGQQQVYQGVSRPSKDITIGFSRPGLVAEVLVKEGDEVKKDQLVARLDDKEEQENLKVDKAKADDMTAVEAEKAVHEKDKGDLKLKEEAHAAAQEIADANLEVLVSEARIAKAQEDHDELVLKYKANAIAVEKMKLNAPIDGTVVFDKSYVQAGENAEANKMNVMRIVQNDPMYVEVPLPIAEVVKHKQGDAAKVTFHKGLQGHEKELSGKIDNIKAVGDASSGTVMVRLIVPNPDKIIPGEIVDVRFETPNVAMKP